jgi:hypothetical protein
MQRICKIFGLSIGIGLPDAMLQLGHRALRLARRRSTARLRVRCRYTCAPVQRSRGCRSGGRTGGCPERGWVQRQGGLRGRCRARCRRRSGRGGIRWRARDSAAKRLNQGWCARRCRTKIFFGIRRSCRCWGTPWRHEIMPIFNQKNGEVPDVDEPFIGTISGTSWWMLVEESSVGSKVSVPLTGFKRESGSKDILHRVVHRRLGKV